MIFVNSDPSLVRFFLRFLSLVGIGPGDWVFRVCIHESADVAEAQRFWLELTGADPAQFRRPVLKRHNPKTVRQNTGDGYHGCLRIEAKRSADLYRRIAGWAAAAMAADTETAQIANHRKPDI
jgi:hypothetical protein